MDVDVLLALVLAADWDEIESARGSFDDDALVELLPAYWKLDTWTQKVAFVNLVQDHDHDRLHPIMLDILRAPLDDVGDSVELTKAIALGFMDEQYDRFMFYYENRDALHADVAEVLVAHGMQLAEQPSPPPPLPLSAPGAEPSDPDAALVTAAKRGDLDRVRVWLDSGAHVDARLSEDTPLLEACVAGHEAVARLLVARGANVSARRVSAQTPLWWAAVHGWIELSRELVARGAAVDQADIYGGTPLLQAAKAHAELSRELIRLGADPRSAYRDGRTPAWFAANDGNTGAVIAMLDAGLGVDEPIAGATLLALACDQNHVALVREVIARGANVDLAPTTGHRAGKTPLMIAAERGFPALVQILLNAGADRDRRFGGQRAIDLATGRRADKIRALLG